MQDIKVTSFLLDIIEKDTNVNKLKYYGLSYKEIGLLIQSNVENGHLVSDNGAIVITKQGKAFLEENKHLIKELDKSKWIDIDRKNKIKSIHKEEVFLPSPKNLAFLKKLL